MLSSIAPVTPVDRPAATSPLRGGGEGGASFAELLQRGQASHGLLAAAPRPSPVSAPPAVAAGDGERDDRTPSETEQARRQSATKAASKAAQRPRERERPAGHASGASADEGERADARTATHPDTARDALPAPDPAAPPTAAATLLAAAEWRAAAASASDLDATGGGPGKSAFGVAVAGTSPAAGAPDGDDAAEADFATADEADATTAASAAMAQPLSTATSEARAAPGPGPTTPEIAPLPSGAAPALPPRSAEFGAPPTVALPAPLQSPEFAGQLAAQVSVWVADGVQQARLNLNPADLGPISVQIRIDGDQAQVAFAADAALTREAIERGLPELAAALREQGLTLSGGGVFEHRSGTGRGSGGDGNQAPGGDGTRAEPVAAPPVRTRMLPAFASGRLDVYA